MLRLIVFYHFNMFSPMLQGSVFGGSSVKGQILILVGPPNVD